MKKIIQVTPEWVLTELAESHFPSGDGNVMACTLEPSNVSWIKLALDTLNISYEINDYDHGDNRVLWGLNFCIDGIKSECPTLYKRLKKMNEEYMNETYKDLPF
jgi:hypothetical protein